MVAAGVEGGGPGRPAHPLPGHLPAGADLEQAAPEVKFAKAHGLGNDFILVPEESAPADVAPWTRHLCDRHEGVGGDGILPYRVDAAAAGSPAPCWTPRARS